MFHLLSQFSLKVLHFTNISLWKYCGKSYQRIDCLHCCPPGNRHVHVILHGVRVPVTDGVRRGERHPRRHGGAASSRVSHQENNEKNQKQSKQKVQAK